MLKLGKKNIVIFIRALKSGGAEKQSLLLAKALKEVFNVLLVVQRGEIVEEKYIKFLTENNVNYVLIKGKLLERSKSFYNLLKRNKTQIIFSYLTSDNFWSAIIGKLAGVRYLVGGVRSNYLPWHKFIITKYLNIWLQDFTIFNNYSGFSEFVQDGFIKEKSVIINNCIDDIPYSIKRNESINLKLLTVARFVEGKDYLTAIKSFDYFLKNLCPKNFEVKYIMIGHGELEGRIKTWIKEYGLSDQISLLVNPPNLMEYYKLSDIYLCTSVYEGFSNSIMEAMMYSLPVIATDVGDNKNLVINNLTGFLTTSNNVVEIAEKINSLIQSYDTRIDFGKAGNMRVKDEFSLQKFRHNYVELIDRLV